MRDWSDLDIDTRGMSSGQIKTFCPKCHGTRRHKSDRSLSVDLDNRRWRCHNPGCDFAGYLDGGYDSATSYKMPVEVPEDPETLPNTYDYFYERGISEDVVRDAGIWNQGPDEMAIPYAMYPGGKPVHIKYRGISKKRFRSSEGTRKVFYGLEMVDISDPVLMIVEGEIDVLSAREAGFLNVVSIPNGASDKNLECLNHSRHMIDQAKRIFIGTDMDEAGVKLAKELTRRIGPEKCYRVRWRSGCNDANDVLRKHGADSIIEDVQSAKPAPIEGIVFADDVRESLWEQRFGPPDIGVSTGYSNLDELYRLKEGKVTITTGVPASGKSIFLASVFFNVAKGADWKFALFTPEQSPSTQFYEDMVPLYTGLEFGKETRQQFDEAISFLDEHFILISPEDQTLANILSLADKVIYRHGVNAIVIDPWTEVEEPDSANFNESRYIKRELTKVRRFAVNRGVYVNIVVHPNAAGGKNEDITAYDLAGSAQWFNKADMMLSIKRLDKNDPYKPVRVTVLKAKFRKYGREGMCYFQYKIPTKQYYPVQYNEEEDRYLAGSKGAYA